MKKLLIALPAIAAVGAAQAQEPLAFVACPIMRDTATVPCWLAEYNGELYYLVTQEDSEAAVYPPSLGHQALIEGTPTNERRCGGQVLADVRISIRPEIDRNCNTILPATDRYQITDARRGPGPGAEPEAGVPSLPPELSDQRVGSQTFEVFYDFDWQTAGRDAYVIQDAAAYAIRNEELEPQVNVIGFRAGVELSDGRTLVEEPDIALRRAQELVETLATLGVSREIIVWADQPEAVVGDHMERRAMIAVVLSGADDPDSEY